MPKALEIRLQLLRKVTDISKCIRSAMPFLLIAGFLFSTIRPVSAQLNVATKANFIEFGLMGGTMVYQGDLSHNYFFYNNYKVAYGAYIAYPLKDRVSARVMYNKGYIAGADSVGLDPEIILRNLDFFSDIHEFSILADFYLLKFNSLSDNASFSPYISTGLTVFHFNPMAHLFDTVYELQPLGTEGQGTSVFPDRKPYWRTQVAVPLEIGFKYTPTRAIGIAIAGGVRVTFTDYLDDVSRSYVNAEALISENGMVSYLLSNRTWEVSEDGLPKVLTNSSIRGGANSNDYYGWIGVTLSYILIPEYKFNVSRKAGIHCPKF
jgi:hypothetical protein